MEKWKTVGIWILSASIIYLSTALILVTIESQSIREELPKIIAHVENMENNLDIADILNAIHALDKQLPEALNQVKLTRVVIDDFNKQVPAILNESNEIRALVPGIVHESQQWREELPGILEQADHVVSKANKVPEHMLEGVVKGTVKSVISAPGDILEGVAEEVGITNQKNGKAPDTTK